MLFSIVIPSYNRAGFIRQTIETLLAQRYENLEILVVDDGSTDNTGEVVGAITDPRVTYYRKENGERGAARNFGAARSRGGYINFFDSDDLAYPNHLEEANKTIREKNSPEVFHLNYDFRKPDGTFIKKGPVEETANKRIILENFLSTNGVFIRSDIARTHPFPEDRRMAVSEDWALWLSLSSRFPFHLNPEITSTYVDHDQRSINDWNPDKIVLRNNTFLEHMMQDETFKSSYKKGLKRFVADRHTFSMLLLAVHKRKKETLHYAGKAMQADWSVIFRKRFIASLIKFIR